MRRAQSLFLLSGLVVIAGCESAPPSPAGATATATTTAAAAAPAVSTSAAAEQPAPAASASASAEPEVVAVQHLLVAYKGAKAAPKTITRSKADAKTRAEEALAKAKKGEDFTELVKAYSDEPGAAERLGSLGKFKRGTKVKAFDDAAFALKLGAVSDVVETEFGFHVIKRNQ